MSEEFKINPKVEVERIEQLLAGWDYFAGLKIVLTDALLHDIRETKKVKAKEKHEVLVKVGEETKTYTLDDFLSRLGFDFKPDLSKVGSNDPSIYYPDDENLDK